MVAAGAIVITGVDIMNGAITAGVVMTTAGITAGINVKPMNAAIAKAGMTAMTDAAVGDVDQATVADMATGIINCRGERDGSPFIF
jgi:hypothetical protein